MTQIFLSYRRADSDVIAGRIRDRLAQAYGDQSVFMDINNIPFGVDFRSHVKETLLQGDLLIAVIGPNWLSRHESGGSRLGDDADPVRLELEAAFERKLPIIPVLVHGAKMPEPAELPPSLRDFAFFNAAIVDSGRDFHPHLDRLIKSITPLLKRSPLRQPRNWAAVGTLLLVLAIGGALLFRNHTPIQTSTEAVKQQPKQTSASQSDSWLAFRSLSITELRATANDMRSKGYSLKGLNGYLLDEAPRYATLWARGVNAPERVGWEFNADAYQKRHDELAGLGLRPVVISAYGGARGIQYADLWTKARAVDWTVRREMSAEALRAAVNELEQRGLHPVHVYGYTGSGSSQFVAIFERRQAESNVISIDTPALGNQKEWDLHQKQGYRPRAISGYRIGNNDFLTTLWEKGPRAGGHFGVTEKNLDSVISQRKNQGFHLVYLNVYPGLGGLRHNLIWEKL